MQPIKDATNEESSGSENIPITPEQAATAIKEIDRIVERLRPFQVAMRLIPAQDNSQSVTVLASSDQQFEAFISQTGMPKDDSITTWSFDDKVRAINYCIQHALPLPFVASEKQIEINKSIDKQLQSSIDL